MASLNFLIFPRLPFSNGKVAAAMQPLEHILTNVGSLHRYSRRDQSLRMALDACDVILLEVKDAEDVAFCREVRTHSLKPMLLYGLDVSAATWVQGLQAGADGFLLLSSPEEILSARLHAVLRWAGLSSS